MSRTPSARSFAVPRSSSTDVTSFHSQSSSYLVEIYTNKASNLDSQQWTDAARVLGIDSADTGRSPDEAPKLTRKIAKRRNLSIQQTSELLCSALNTMISPHQRFRMSMQSLFCRDAIPNFAPRLDSTANRRMGMIPPRPAVVVGYQSQAFSCIQRELQHGIISDIDGTPRDLSRLSHVCKDTYWPFLLVEISDSSIQAASDIAIEGTATCNNALMTLASALLDQNSVKPDEGLTHCVNQSVASFSLAIHRKTVRVIAHYSEGFTAESVGVVQTYNLEFDRDVTALLTRVRNILTWAEEVRLKAIFEMLDMLDRRVKFSECIKLQETSMRGPMDMVGVGKLPLDGMPNEKKGLLKSVIGSSMPSWSRVEI